MNLLESGSLNGRTSRLIDTGRKEGDRGGKKGKQDGGNSR